MRKFLFILGALLAYLLFSSKSCDSDEKDDSVKQEAELTQTKKSIKDEFESDDLSRKSLRAFEVKAEQKLVDLADYLRIYTDKTLEKAFKDQARQMITDLFISDSVLINSFLIIEKDQKILLITEFPGINPFPGFNTIDFLFDSIEVTRPLLRTGESSYTGNMSFTLRMIAYSSADTAFSSPVKMEVDMIASKVKKTFGTDTLRVWGVYLGNIK